MQRKKYSKAERKAIDEHKYLLSETAGYDVGLDAAIRDWEANHAPCWRRARQVEMLEMQKAEIRRHIWIESEKARCDLGTQAKLDWIRKHAATWREWYDGKYGMSS